MRDEARGEKQKKQTAQRVFDGSSNLLRLQGEDYPQERLLLAFEGLFFLQRVRGVFHPCGPGARTLAECWAVA